MTKNNDARATRVLLLTQYFPPEPYPQTLWLAEALRGEGLAVRVLTSVPNYPTGKVLPGYRGFKLQREEVSSFSVTRVPVYPSHSTDAVGRIVNYGSFGLSAMATSRSALSTADVVLVWATPATVGLPALVESHLSGTPYILYVQDLWPDSIFASGFLGSPKTRSLAERSLQPLLSSMYSNAAHIVAISPGMEKELVGRGVSKEHCTHIYNWVDEDMLSPRDPNGMLRQTLGLSKSHYLMAYAGNIGTAQGLGPWVEAMARLPSDSPAHLVFIGDGSDKRNLERQVSDRGLLNVHFLPSVPANQLADVLADVDVLAISLADQDLFRITMPSKVQACLALGKPVVAAVAGDAREVIMEANAGWLAEPEDVGSILAAVLESQAAGGDEREGRGRSGRSFYENHMSKTVGSKAMADLVASAAKRGLR